MKQIRNLEQLNIFSYFDTETVGQVTGLGGQLLNNIVYRWTESGRIVRLKNGVYVTSKYFDANRSSRNYIEFMSNKLRYPSYVSLEYVLSYYGVLSESVFGVTAVTTKVPREYANQLGRFTYRSIKDELFTGFIIEKKDGFDISIATKAKALFDYLYLKFFRKSLIPLDIIDSLRLNLDSFTQKEIREFTKYCKLTGVAKYKALPNLLFSK